MKIDLGITFARLGDWVKQKLGFARFQSGFAALLLVSLLAPGIALAATYSVAYNGNGSTGGSVPATVSALASGASVTVQAPGSLTKTGQAFVVWNTKANASGTSYQPGQTLANITANVTLYAQWGAPSTLTYSGNGSTGGAVPVDSKTYGVGGAATVMGNPNGLVKPGYTLAAWNTVADGSGTNYSVGLETFNITGNTTLYAQWTPEGDFFNGDFEAGTPTSPFAGWIKRVLQNNLISTTGTHVIDPKSIRDLNLGTAPVSIDPATPSFNVYAGDTAPPLTTDLSNRVNGPVGSLEDPLMAGHFASLRVPFSGANSALVNLDPVNHVIARTNTQPNGVDTYTFEAKRGSSIKQRVTVTATDVDPSDGKVHVRFVLAPVLDNPGLLDAAGNPIPAALTGTVGTTNGSTTVTGTGTHFTQELVVGWSIVINGISKVISSITNDTTLVITGAWTGSTNASWSAAYTSTGGHYPEEQPFFAVELRKVDPVTGNPVAVLGAPASSTGQLFFQFNFSNQPGTVWSNKVNTVDKHLYTYSNFQSFDISPGNAKLAVGDTIELEVVAAGCSKGGHEGHIYVDNFSLHPPVGLWVSASGPASVSNASGTTITYTYNYSNNGASPVNNVTVTAPMPQDSVTGFNSTFWSKVVTAPGASCSDPGQGNAGTVSCNFGTLAPGASGSFTVTVTIPSGATTGPINNGAYSISGTSVSALTGPMVQTNLVASNTLVDMTVNASGLPLTATSGVSYSGSFTCSNSTNTPVTTANSATCEAANLPTGVIVTGCTISGTGFAWNQLDTVPDGNTVTCLVAGTPSATGTFNVQVTTGATNDKDTSNNTASRSVVVSLLTYTVTYSGNSNTGGTVPTDATAYGGGATVTVAANSGSLVRTGYTFGGWNTQADGLGTNYAAGIGTFTISANTTLYAKWNAVTYSVTYSGNSNTGGTVPTDATAYGGGATVTVAANSGSLVRTGYTFGGWNTQADGLGTNYAAGIGTFTISANTTLYAKWNAVTYSVTYSGNSNTGGTVPTDATAYGGGATVTVAANSGSLVRTGYTFGGWNTQADGLGTNYAAGIGTFTISANTTLYAKWNAVPTYSVTYDGNGGTGSVPTDGNTYAQNASVTVAGVGALVKTGFTFVGWNTAANGSGIAKAAGSTYTMGAASVRFYAQWTAIMPPIAVNDSATTNYNTAVTIAVSANDRADAGTSLALDSIDLNPFLAGRQTTRLVAGEGSFTANNDGTVTFTPVAGFQGVVTVAYTIQDSLGQTSNVADMSVTVRSQTSSSGPIAQNDVGAALPSTPVILSVLANDSPGVGTTLNLTSIVLSGTNPAQGIWVANANGTVTFTPAAGFVGTATANYTVRDSAGLISNSATISVSVGGGSAPSAQNDSAATPAATAVTLPVLSNDLPGSGYVLDPTSVMLSGANPAQGVWLVNANGSVTFTPAAGFTGVATANYTVRDSSGGTSNIASIAVTVNPASPAASNDFAGAGHRTLSPASNDTASPGASLNPSTVDLDPLTPGVQRGPIVTAQGTWQVIDDNGTVSFAPAAGFYGTATLNYAISDSLGNTATATMSVPIDPSGVAYSSTTRLPLAGATVTLLYNGGSANADVVGGNATQTTNGAGQYAFFLTPGARTGGNYSLTVSLAGYTFVSTALPPAAGSWPAGGGPIAAVIGAPTGAQSTLYYLSGPLPSADIINNNIPLDPVVAPPPPTSVTPIPTLSEWGLVILAGLLTLFGLGQVRRRGR